MAEAETEADTEDEAMMREKAECIERARSEEEAKSRAEDDMIKQVWRAKSLEPRQWGSSLRQKFVVSEDQAKAKAETDIE